MTVTAGTLVLAKVNSSGSLNAIGGGGLTVNGGGLAQLGGTGGNQFYNWAGVTVASGGASTPPALATFPTTSTWAGPAGINGAGALVNSVAASSTLTTQNGGSIALTGNASIGVTQAAGSLTLNYPITDNGSGYALTKIGAGTLILTGSTPTAAARRSAAVRWHWRRAALCPAAVRSRLPAVCSISAVPAIRLAHSRLAAPRGAERSK